MAQETNADQEMKSIARIASSASRRSPLYRWLRTRHDVFLELVNETRPKWKALAGGFADLGLLSPEGKPLTPEAVRHTWWRVRRDVAASRRKRVEKAVTRTDAVTPVSPVSVTPREAPSPPFDAGDALARIREKINERSGRKT